MPEVTEQSRCDVVALVPGPSDTATLLCAHSALGGDAERRLPTVTLAAEPTIETIVPSLRELLGTDVIPLRANGWSWYPNFDTASMIVEVEPVHAEVSSGFTWIPIDHTVVEALSPEWARPTIASWLEERTSGWNALRPQWSRPGWLAEAGSWMREQMERAGYEAPREPRVHHLWGVSVVLVAESRSGTAYLKCSGDRFRGEAVVTQALAERSPALLPEVVAVEPDRGWLLMRDFNGTELGEEGEPSWGVGLDALVRLQQTWLGRTDELLALGAEERSLSSLATWVEGIAGNAEILNALTPNERERWLEAAPSFVQACHRLADLGPGLTLVHGDFHPWNVVARDGSALIFDWTDASVTHPVLDVVTYVMRTDDVARRRDLLARYLDGWVGHVSSKDLQELGDLALVVGAVHQAHTYSRLIPTVMPDDLADLRGGDVYWIQRALRFRDEGLEGKY